MAFSAFRRRLRRNREWQRHLRACESLEPRSLMAVEILGQEFMRVEYELVASSFSGTDFFGLSPDPPYRASFKGEVTGESGFVQYTSPTLGTGSGTGTGTMSGSENYRPTAKKWGPFECSFEGYADVVLDGHSVSRAGAGAHVSCSGGESTSTSYDAHPSGTIDYSTLPFRADMTWAESYDGGNGFTQGRLTATFLPVASEDYNIALSGLEWVPDGSGGVKVQFQVVGPPQPTGTLETPITDITLYWSQGTKLADVISGPLSSPIPIYWNQKGGVAVVTGLPEPPAEATHLFVMADFANAIDETEEFEDNRCALRLTGVRNVEWNKKRDSEPQAGHRGIDVTLANGEQPAPAGAELVYYWANGPTLDNVLSEIERKPVTGEATASGTHIVNNKAHWSIPPEEATHIVVELQAPDADFSLQEGECGELPTVRALLVHQPLEIMGGALSFHYGATLAEIDAEFKPGGGAFTISEAEVVMGVDHFAWLQDVEYPSYMELFIDSTSKYHPTPYRDPSIYVENLNRLYLYSEYARGTEDNLGDPAKFARFASAFVDSLPYYHDEVAVNPGSSDIEIRSKTTSAMVTFHDEPRVPHDFYDPMPEADDFTFFTTVVSGVSQEGSPVKLYPAIPEYSRFTWRSNAVYDRDSLDPSGGIEFYRDPGDPGDPILAGGISEIQADPVVLVPLTAAADEYRSREPGPYALDVLANDTLPAGVPLAIGWISNPAHGSVVLDEGGTPDLLADDRLIYTPEAGFSGDVSFQYTLFRRDLLDFVTATVTVGTGDPVASIAAPNFVLEGDNFQLHGGGTPGGGAGPLTYEWDLDANGQFAEDPIEEGETVFLSALTFDGAPGSVYPVALRVRDAGGTVSAALMLDVPVLNRAPTVNAGGPYSVDLGQTLVLDGASAFDAGHSFDPLVFEWDLDGDGQFGETGAGAARGDETGLTPQFSAAGALPNRVSVSFRATDDEGAVSRLSTAEISIEGGNLAPTDILVSNLSVFENRLGAIIGQLTVVDADANETFTWFVSDPRFVVENGVLRLAPDQALDAEAASQISLDLEVTDSASHALTRTFVIAVQDINEPPQRTAGTLPDITLPRSATPLALGLTALTHSAVEAGQTLSYVVEALPPSELGEVRHGDGMTAVVSGDTLTPAQWAQLMFAPSGNETGGPAPFTYRVQDNGGLAHGGADWLVESLSLAVSEANAAPVLGAIGVRKIGEQRELIVTVAATDDDGDALDFACDTLPPGATFQPLTREFRWMPTVGQKGVYTLRFTASDGLSDDFEEVTITVSTPWHNEFDRYDVNAQFGPTNTDLFLILVELRGRGARDLRLDEPFAATPPYFDLSDDYLLTNTDLFLELAELRRLAALGGEGEAAADDVPADSAIADAAWAQFAAADWLGDLDPVSVRTRRRR